MNDNLDVTNNQNPDESDDLAALTQEQLDRVSGGRHSHGHRHHGHRHHRHYAADPYAVAPVVRPVVRRYY